MVDGSNLPYEQLLADYEAANKKLARMEQRTAREKLARQAAEDLLTTKSRELFAAKQALDRTIEDLEKQVETRTEEYKIATEKAEKATEAKGRFLASMSHEIRTPLTGLLGLAKFLLQSDLSDEQMEWAKNIDKSGRSLLTILNDILDQAKLESGEFTLSPEEFSLSDLIERCVATFEEQARKKGIEIKTEFDFDGSDKLFGDDVRIGQILLNLISNAVKFTDEGAVTIRVLTTDFGTGSIQLMVRVSDTGIGMNQSHMETLFKPFMQADESISRRFGGTGLGLSISKQLATLMGGELSASSVLGKGTTFDLDLSLKRPESERPAAKLEPIAGVENLTLLAAEDVPLNQMIIRKLCTDMGHQIHIVNNGQEALDWLKENTADVILMDVRMPIMDGITATMAIRDILELDTPIIGLTADLVENNVSTFIDSGMDTVVGKPIDPEMLATAITTFYLGHVAKHRPLSA